MWIRFFSALHCCLLSVYSFGLNEHVCPYVNDTMGSWKYLGYESSGFSHCPVASRMFDIVPIYKRQKDAYSCSNYSSASFEPFSCRILPLAESLQILNHKLSSGAIVFVGDSLMCQQVHHFFL